jgi:hypothetical protein
VGLADYWNTRPEDLEGEWACDALATAGAAGLYRAVDIDAPVSVVWRWLCQLRAAPYSYDWIDNRGRRSPAELTPGLDRLEVGQTVMTIFRLVGFGADDHLTRAGAGFLGLGPRHVTYRLRQRSHGTRVAVKLSIGGRRDWLGAVLLRGLAIGDLIMMRKQLLTLKAYAEAGHTAE